MVMCDGDGDVVMMFMFVMFCVFVECLNGVLCVFVCDGVVFDVMFGKDFYGVGGLYVVLNGCDVMWVLVMMKINVLDVDEVFGVCGLMEEELKMLGEWRAKFESKYLWLGTFERRGEGN